MKRNITAALISKWHDLQLDGYPTQGEYDDLRHEFGTALPFFIKPAIYENFPFTLLGEPEIKISNLTPIIGEAWVLFCYQKVYKGINSPIRTDGFMLPFEWRENTGHSSLIPESMRRLADQILSTTFLNTSLSDHSQSQTSSWGLHPSYQRFGDTIDFSDSHLFGENVGSAWGALAAGLATVRNRYVPARWPFCSIQFDYMSEVPVNVEGIERKLAVAASYGCREFIVAPCQVSESLHALDELKEMGVPGTESIRIVASASEPGTIINSILHSHLDWLTETIRSEIRKENGKDPTSPDEKGNSKEFNAGALASGVAGGVLAFGASTVLADMVFNEKKGAEHVRNETLHTSIDRDGISPTKIESFDMPENNEAPKKWGIDSTNIVSPDVEQEHPDTCAIRSQELILRDFGINVSEDELVNKAIEKGWYHSGHGTPMNDVGNLLEEYGLDVNRCENANIFTLCSELAQNHKVIIGVDSGELWHKGTWEKIQDFMGLEKADHALLVSGIDTSDPDNIKVILTDPGTGDVAKEYPAAQFMDAWKDSGYFMVATKDPAPASLPASAHFDYNVGHLTSFGGWQFSELNDAAMQSSYVTTNNDTNIKSEIVNQLFQNHALHDSNCNVLNIDALIDSHRLYIDTFHTSGSDVNSGFDFGTGHEEKINHHDHLLNDHNGYDDSNWTDPNV